MATAGYSSHLLIKFLQAFDSVIEVATVTATNYSSMLQDVAHQRQTEIEFTNSFLCEQTRQISLISDK
ncbi:MAG: hypothetical protein GY896_22515 [Gammaproteobacteria bacterium]|nr:hypothetical protein [Gammaproteobacteria bacterium]